jgi:hypothetical protein
MKRLQLPSMWYSSWRWLHLHPYHYGQTQRVSAADVNITPEM